MIKTKQTNLPIWNRSQSKNEYVETVKIEKGKMVFDFFDEDVE